MKKILTIFLKELKDTPRDRRSIMLMFVFPILMIFVMMNLIITLGRSQERKAEEKVLTVALVKKGKCRRFPVIPGKAGTCQGQNRPGGG